MKLQLKLKSLVTLNGMLGVPGGICLGIWAMAAPLIWVDSQVSVIGNPVPFWLAISADTARSLLGTIASAAITTLGLAYSIMLVVFTLAAGNIAPRLLQRFSRDRVNQVTAGVLGGTFLYSLSVLRVTGPDFRPELSIALAFALAVVSVLQVIHFVHSVSRSVTIDAEVATISKQLEGQVNALVAKASGNGGEFDAERLETTVKAEESGYVTIIDETSLIKLGSKRDLLIEVRVAPGDFVLLGQPLARISSGADEDGLIGGVREAISLEPYRGAVNDIRFSVRILLEIALRALSPGVNDTFTAVACADRLAAALVKPVSEGLRDDVLCDEEGVPRLKVPGLSLEELLNMTIHPLRQAAKGNILMLDHLGGVLNSLYSIAGPDARQLIQEHGQALMDTMKSSGPIRSDMDFLEKRLEFDTGS
ncbi:DUF2254 domain-containing protein [Hoeflea sp.]|uniref:DUF2254 domain-containing protein n=1 Tax=Hoeflea sp. TaxID=1940281 RepID=UPI003B5194CB